VIVGSGPAARFTARGNEILSEAGTVLARVEYFGWARRMMRVFVGSTTYRSRSFWRPHTLQEADTGRTVIIFKRSWLSLRFRLVFPSGELLQSSSTSRAMGGRLSLSDARGVVIEVFRRDDAPRAGVRDQQRRDLSTHIVVHREGIPNLLLVIVLAGRPW
jgi:hypothetical protein